jgi:hypothetical protein
VAIDNLLRYSKQLAIKLRDPVDDGRADGQTYFSEFRFGYLTRGFGKLIRNLECLDLDIEYVFPQLYSIKSKFFNEKQEFVDIKSNSAEEYTINNKSIPLDKLIGNPAFKIYKAIAKSFDNKKSFRGRETAINNAFDVLFGLGSEHYNTTDENSFIYYISGGRVNFVSNDKIKVGSVNMLIKTPLPKFSPDSTMDLVIPVEYEDIFLSLAALEAVIDIGNVNGAQLYRADINSELKLLALKKDIQRTRETTDPMRNG